MINVALDTNIYRKKPRLDSPEFKALVFLSKNNCVRLHIPFFVENEFRSQIAVDQTTRIESVLATLKKMCEFPILSQKTSELIGIIEYLNNSKYEIITERENDFSQWADEINATRYSLSNSETLEALSAYFYGKPPFKEAKVRKDIPDSFIFQSLLNIQANLPLCVVVEDGKLREACELSGISCYKDLSSFIESEEVKILLQGRINDDVLGALESKIIEFLAHNQSLLLERIEESLLSDEYRMISGDCIPGEQNEIFVSGVNKPYEIQLSDDIEHYGDSLFLVDFSAKVEFLYEYSVYRSEAYDLDPKKFHMEYLNDHYFNVETTDNFVFHGRIELDYPINLEEIESIAELLSSLSDPDVSIEDLEGFEVCA